MLRGSCWQSPTFKNHFVVAVFLESYTLGTVTPDLLFESLQLRVFTHYDYDFILNTINSILNKGGGGMELPLVPFLA